MIQLGFLSSNKEGMALRRQIFIFCIFVVVVFTITVKYISKSEYSRNFMKFYKLHQYNILPDTNITSNNDHIKSNFLKVNIETNNQTKSLLTLLQKNLDQALNSIKESTLFKSYEAYQYQLRGPETFLKNRSKNIEEHVVHDSVQKDCIKKLNLLILVSSNAPHSDRRSMIRKHWGNISNWKTNFTWKVVFITGAAAKQVMHNLHVEANLYKDIVMENINESFYRMSYKVMIGLQWAYTYLKFDYLLKCDDDVFVQIDHLMERLSTSKDHFFGQRMFHQPVERSGRYGVSKEEYFKDHYDPYCSGGGFILSYETVYKMIPFFNWTQPLKIDDAYMGILAAKAGVETVHYNGFMMWNNNCQYAKDLIISHPVTQANCLQFLMKNSLTENGKLKNNAIGVD